MTIRKNIRKLRAAARLTQDQLAQRTRQRIAVTILLLGITAALWMLGALVLGPLVRDYVAAHYKYGVMMLFRGGYQALAAMLLSAGVLSLMGLYWDLSLGKRGRRAAQVIAGLLLAETLCNVLVSFYLGWWFEGGVLGPFSSLVLYLTMKEYCIPLSLLCGAALFLAVNPARKTESERGNIRKTN